MFKAPFIIVSLSLRKARQDSNSTITVLLFIGNSNSVIFNNNFNILAIFQGFVEQVVKNFLFAQTIL